MAKYVLKTVNGDLISFESELKDIDMVSIKKADWLKVNSNDGRIFYINSQLVVYITIE